MMKSVDRKRICTQCDGQISYEAKECPYCGSNLKINPSLNSSFNPNKGFTENAHSLYPPTYQQTTPKQPPITPPSEPKNYLDEAVEKVQPIKEEAKQSLWPLFSLTLGSMGMTLGLLFLFFSSEGKLSLEWNSSYWFVYCLFALPLIWIGYKKLS